MSEQSSLTGPVCVICGKQAFALIPISKNLSDWRCLDHARTTWNDPSWKPAKRSWRRRFLLWLFRRI